MSTDWAPGISLAVNTIWAIGIGEVAAGEVEEVRR